MTPCQQRLRMPYLYRHRGRAYDPHGLLEREIDQHRRAIDLLDLDAVGVKVVHERQHAGDA